MRLLRVRTVAQRRGLGTPQEGALPPRLGRRPLQGQSGAARPPGGLVPGASSCTGRSQERAGMSQGSAVLGAHSGVLEGTRGAPDSPALEH